MAFYYEKLVKSVNTFSTFECQINIDCYKCQLNFEAINSNANVMTCRVNDANSMTVLCYE